MPQSVSVGVLKDFESGWMETHTCTHACLCVLVCHRNMNICSSYTLTIDGRNSQLNWQRNDNEISNTSKSLQNAVQQSFDVPTDMVQGIGIYALNYTGKCVFCVCPFVPY